MKEKDQDHIDASGSLAMTGTEIKVPSHDVRDGEKTSDAMTIDYNNQHAKQFLEWNQQRNEQNERIADSLRDEDRLIANQNLALCRIKSNIRLEEYRRSHGRKSSAGTCGRTWGPGDHGQY